MREFVHALAPCPRVGAPTCNCDVSEVGTSVAPEDPFDTPGVSLEQMAIANAGGNGAVRVLQCISMLCEGDAAVQVAVAKAGGVSPLISWLSGSPRATAAERVDRPSSSADSSFSKDARREAAQDDFVARLDALLCPRAGVLQGQAHGAEALDVLGEHPFSGDHLCRAQAHCCNLLPALPLPASVGGRCSTSHVATYVSIAILKLHFDIKNASLLR